MALVCAFLTMGLNLQVSTEQNLEAIYDSYEVIAVPDFQAYVTRTGELASMGTHAGYWPCEATNDDLSPVLQVTGVESVDVRNRFGAYVGNEGFERGFTYTMSKRRRIQMSSTLYTKVRNRWSLFPLFISEKDAIW